MIRVDSKKCPVRFRARQERFTVLVKFINLYSSFIIFSIIYLDAIGYNGRLYLCINFVHRMLDVRKIYQTDKNCKTGKIKYYLVIYTT